MTLDDLTKLFQAARGRGNLTRTEGDLKGIRRVVLALRDEMTLGWEDDRPWGDVADVKKFMNKILGSDAEGSAAGGPTREDGRDGAEPVVTAPATDLIKEMQRMGQEWDAAPNTNPNLPNSDLSPQCEWKINETGKESGFRWSLVQPSCCPEFKDYGAAMNRQSCPSCGLPIKFKEPSHGI